MTELFSDESRWTKGTSARDANGKSCSPLSNRAVCWCLSGAVERLANKDKETLRKYWKILREVIGLSVTGFNDHKETRFTDIQRVAKEFDKRVEAL